MVDSPRTAASQKATAVDARAAIAQLSVVLGVVRKKWHHHAPTAFAPFGHSVVADTSSDKLRRCARCTKCGTEGATLKRPSWMAEQIGFAPFPVPKVADE